MKYWVKEDGTLSYCSRCFWGIYPRYCRCNLLDGVLVGGYQGGNLKVSGQIYRTGTVKGYIVNGVATDGVRMYRIKKIGLHPLQQWFAKKLQNILKSQLVQ